MKRILFLAIALMLVGIACKKPPGDGGTSFIKGKISKEVRLVLTNPSTKQYTIPAADEDVYIIYGDNTGPDDRIKTNYDGEFEFTYMREGKYTIYVYSKDTTGLAGVDPNRMKVVTEVEITERKQTVNAQDLTIYDD